MLLHFVEVAQVALGYSGQDSFEWPRHNTGCMNPDLISVIFGHGLVEDLVDGCACGIVDAKDQPDVS